MTSNILLISIPTLIVLLTGLTYKTKSIATHSIGCILVVTYLILILSDRGFLFENSNWFQIACIVTVLLGCAQMANHNHILRDRNPKGAHQGNRENQEIGDTPSEHTEPLN